MLKNLTKILNQQNSDKRLTSNYTKVKFKVESFDEVAKSAKLCVA